LRDDGIPRDQTLEINLDHPVCIGLNALRKTERGKATLLTQQVVDNALLAAGLLDDPRVLVPRLNELIKSLVPNKKED
jgi:HSP90 family molecular chaperone